MRDYQSFEVRNVSVIGHSGAGKTSVLEAIASYIDNIKTISEYQNYLKIGLDNLQFFRKNNDKHSQHR